MYNLDILLKLKELKIDIKEYLLLKIVEDCSLSLLENLYLRELIKLREEKYIIGNNLSFKGEELLKSIEKNKTSTVDYNKLHLSLQNKLLSLTNKKQFMVGGKYSFLPNKIDFSNKLKNVILKYKLKDIDKIEKLLLLHIEKAVKERFQYISLLGYYISKDGKSQLYDDYESYEENEKFIEPEKIEPKKIKNLF